MKRLIDGLVALGVLMLLKPALAWMVADPIRVAFTVAISVIVVLAVRAWR
jgi:hypothetical protein